MRRFASIDRFAESAGERLGVSGWHGVEQPRIDRFAEVTGDRQWIHRAEGPHGNNPFGGPVAHGFLLVSLLPAMLSETFAVDGVVATVNKAVRQARFRAPVPAGARVRSDSVLESVRARPRGYWEAVIRAGIECEGRPEPAADAELVLLLDCH